MRDLHLINLLPRLSSGSQLRTGPQFTRPPSKAEYLTTRFSWLFFILLDVVSVTGFGPVDGKSLKEVVVAVVVILIDAGYNDPVSYSTNIMICLPKQLVLL